LVYSPVRSQAETGVGCVDTCSPVICIRCRADVGDGTVGSAILVDIAGLARSIGKRGERGGKFTPVADICHISLHSGVCATASDEERPDGQS
jgi:hypothetical protein